MFVRFTDSDFDAFAPAKWRSNVFNRERLEVKQRLLPLASRLAHALVGPDGAPLDTAASLEHPALLNHKQVEAQHLFFFRGEAARRQLDTIIDKARGVASLLDDPTPQRSHVFLAVSVSHERLEVALRLHPEASVDRQNLLRRCQDPFELDRLLLLLRELPTGFSVGLPPEIHSTASISRDELEIVLRKLGAQPTAGLGSSVPFTVTLAHSRADVLALGDEAEARVAADLLALLPVYRFCAWARDNDFVSVREALEKTEAQRRQKGLSRGDAVRVVRGLLSGQQGTVQEVDTRGVLRVLVGKLTVKVDAADVELRS